MAATFPSVTPPLASVRTRPVTMIDGFAQLRRRHVVEQNGVDRFLQRFAQLLERVDLDFDLDHVPDARARRRDGRANRAASAEMIILDQDAVVETEAVIPPPPQRTA